MKTQIVNKTYCSGCKYCSPMHAPSGRYAISCCMHDSNTRIDSLAYTTVKRLININDANKNNDCSKYEKKPWWMFWRG